jgi:hypothetical protein
LIAGEPHNLTAVTQRKIFMAAELWTSPDQWLFRH